MGWGGVWGGLQKAITLKENRANIFTINILD